MHVTDLYGKEITVTNLKVALELVAEYKELRHNTKGYEKMDDERQAYWGDFYEKLLKLQT